MCHVEDTAGLYLTLLSSILSGADPGHGKNGYYLAACGSIAWDDLYASMATALAKRGIVDDATVLTADAGALDKLGDALGCPPAFARIQLSGR